MKHPLNITILPAFGDNYIYLAEYAAGKCFVVDPGDAEPVLKALKNRADAAPPAQLTHILATHHHADHIGGIVTLKQQTDCEVIGPDRQRIGTIDTVVSNADQAVIGDFTVNCMATPGHTATSVCYYVTGSPLTPPVLFSGDTLFVSGCGRMFECDGQTMFASLQKLTALPDETRVYAGHNYTEENLRFALMVTTDNEALREKLTHVQNQNQTGRPTVPSTIAEEKRLNPFLRASDWKTFSTLRQKKDVF